jgi:hypothetical protein
MLLVRADRLFQQSVSPSYMLTLACLQARVKQKALHSCLQAGNTHRMDVREFARLGGQARAKSLSAKQRREIAAKAARASAVARKKKAAKKDKP